MGDPASTEGDAVEQVQIAVLTLIGAARVALDAVEALVADRSRLDELAASGRDLAGTLRTSLAEWWGRDDVPGPAAAGAPSPGDDPPAASGDPRGGNAIP